MCEYYIKLINRINNHAIFLIKTIVFYTDYFNVNISNSIFNKNENDLTQKTNIIFSNSIIEYHINRIATLITHNLNNQHTYLIFMVLIIITNLQQWLPNIIIRNSVYIYNNNNDKTVKTNALFCIYNINLDINMNDNNKNNS